VDPFRERGPSLETRARKFPARGLGWLQQPISPQGNGSLGYCCPKREGSAESTVEPDPSRDSGGGMGLLP